jgi:hypothetical protein
LKKIAPAFGRGKSSGLRRDKAGRFVHLSAVETLVNVLFKLEPSACTVAMIATAIPAAISPYSIAVAPDSLRINRITMVRIEYPPAFTLQAPARWNLPGGDFHMINLVN